MEHAEEIWTQFSSQFAPAVKEVVEFAKQIPQFMDLDEEDQIQLMKSGAFEVSRFCLLPLCRLSEILNLKTLFRIHSLKKLFSTIRVKITSFLRKARYSFMIQFGAPIYGYFRFDFCSTQTYSFGLVIVH